MDFVETNGNVGGFVGAFLGAAIGLVIFIVIIALAVLIVQIVAQCKVYKKAGKPAWAAIVPFYSEWVFCEICEVEKWFFALLIAYSVVELLDIKYLVSLALLANLAGRFFCNYNLALKFKKDPIPYALGLTMLPVIFYSILGFGKSEFEDVPVSKYGPVADGTSTSKPNVEEKKEEEPKKGTKAKKEDKE